MVARGRRSVRVRVPGLRPSRAGHGRQAVTRSPVQSASPALGQPGAARRSVAVVVPAAPVAMARPRVAVRGGHPHAYVPAKTQQAAWQIRQCAIAALGDQEPFSGPVRLTVTAHVPVPKSLPKRLRGIAQPTRRPDLDNYIKLLLDGCSPLWSDDSQVVDLRAVKAYAWDRQPQWSITVEEA
ncbi:MAG: RusA family crossover junction endodeoxyribonuclease [Candidatus Dormibacteria bacterium]